MARVPRQSADIVASHSMGFRHIYITGRPLIKFVKP